MRVLVTGTGRGGTTLLREVVIGFGTLRFHCGPRAKEEDTDFFKRKDLPESYMTKLATPNPPGINTSEYTTENLIRRMEEYEDLHVIFSFRHPVDTCMSKIIRGQRGCDGGDKHWDGVTGFDHSTPGDKVSPDGTVEGAILSVKTMQMIHQVIQLHYPKRVLTVQMENLIMNSEDMVEKIARFLGVKVGKRSLAFYKYNSNRYQFQRYGTKLDKSQVGLYKNWQTAFDGFFKNKEADIKKIQRAFVICGRS